MKIEIETDGTAPRTKITINGRSVEGIKEFKFSVAVVHQDDRGRRRGGACKMQIMREVEHGRIEPLEYYGNGFEKFSEENLWKEAGYVGDAEPRGTG